MNGESKRKGTDTEQDRISGLPDNAIDHILSCLPIRDAAKTCVLSTKWRYKWVMVPTLVFDEQSFPVSRKGFGNLTANELARGIDHALLRHRGPILKFELCYEQYLSDSEVDKWVFHVSRSSLKELVLSFPKLGGYAIPSWVFSCQNLSCLNLLGCSVRPPSTFRGFKNLKSLDLCRVKAAQDVLEYLISGSPMLESLTLRDVIDLKCINIDAPNLQFFYLQGKSVRTSLKNTSRLEVVTMNADDHDTLLVPILLHSAEEKLTYLMAEIPQIKKLCIGGECFEYLARSHRTKELLFPRSFLDTLCIGINLSCEGGTSALAYLLSGVPNLQELQIYSCFCPLDYLAMDFIWEADVWNHPFKRLRHVKISNFKGCGGEMDFIKFMLLTAPVLERMVITFRTIAEDKYKLMAVKQLCGFKRASPRGEINFC